MKTRFAPLDGVLTHMLKDLHDAEIQLCGALPLLWEGAQRPDLAEVLREFLHESTRQAAMLSTLLGGISSNHAWRGMRATIEEVQEVAAGVEDDSIKDLLLVSGCLRIKALKIAAYGTARSMAEKRGDIAASRLLEDVLAQEMEGDLKLMEFVHEALLRLGMAAH